MRRSKKCVRLLLALTMLVTVGSMLNVLDSNDGNSDVQSNDKVPSRSVLQKVEVELTATAKLNYPAPLFLPNYKNPCWFEDPLHPVANYSVSRRRTRQDHHPSNLALLCLPYFFIGGFQKSGTSDLHDNLVHHPELVPPSIKEPHYWARSRYVAGKTIGAYVHQFYSRATKAISRSKRISETYPDGFHSKITWDASPNTVYGNWHWKSDVSNDPTRDEAQIIVADHIQYLLPKAKIILMIRHPTDRLYSDYLHAMNDALPSNPPGVFHEKVQHAISWFQNCTETFQSPRTCMYYPNEKPGSHRHRRWGWAEEPRVRMTVSMYGEHVREWLRVFPREQLLVIRLEDYARNRTEQLLKVVNFLDISNPSSKLLHLWRSSTISNRNKKKKRLGPMLPETKRLLDDFYQPDLNKLALMLNDQTFAYNERK